MDRKLVSYGGTRLGATNPTIRENRMIFHAGELQTTTLPNENRSPANTRSKETAARADRLETIWLAAKYAAHAAIAGKRKSEIISVASSEPALVRWTTDRQNAPSNLVDRNAPISQARVYVSSS